MLASKNGFVDVVKELLHDRRVGKEYKVTELMIAARKGQASEVESLIKSGEDINQSDIVRDS